MLWWWSLAFLSLVLLSSNVRGDGECTPNGPLCQDGFCCSKAGYCGQTDAYCAPGNCQSQCPTPSPPPPPPPPPGPPPPPPAPGGVADFVTPELFEELLAYRNDPRCHAVGFYTYDAFIQAAESFPEFGRTGDNATRKREIAAFLGQTSHETTGGWDGADGGRYAWGYCYKEEQDDRSAHCSASTNYPCAAGKYYFGRGPIQISWNYNYGPCGEAIGLGLELLNTPEVVSSDPLIAFKTAIWFWMTPQAPKPSCHDVMVGAWTPSSSDVAAGRVAGYGLTTNIINGGLECKGGVNQDRNVDRIGFYERYCEKLGTETGDNLDCYNQDPYGNRLLNSFNPIIEEVVSVV